MAKAKYVFNTLSLVQELPGGDTFAALLALLKRRNSKDFPIDYKIKNLDSYTDSMGTVVLDEESARYIVNSTMSSLEGAFSVASCIPRKDKDLLLHHGEWHEAMCFYLSLHMMTPTFFKKALEVVLDSYLNEVPIAKQVACALGFGSIAIEVDILHTEVVSRMRSLLTQGEIRSFVFVEWALYKKTLVEEEVENEPKAVAEKAKLELEQLRADISKYEQRAKKLGYNLKLVENTNDQI